MYRNCRTSTLFLLLALGVTSASSQEPASNPADAPSAQSSDAGAGTADEDTPEKRMNRRFPQKVRVGDLLGLALQDEDDRVLGHVEHVVRTRDGKIVLVTTYGSWFGLGGRHVGVPLETVAILARHIDVLDIPRKDFPSLPIWRGTGATDISPDETIRIAITRR
jgi:uncharacterized protein (DUF2126 family)